MILPLYDDNPFRLARWPWASWGLLAACIVTFVLVAVCGDTSAIERGYGFVPADPHLHALVTYQFLHGGVLHLLGNMLVLFVFADNLEQSLGPWRFLAFYLACGIAGAVLYAATAASPSVPLVGASGALSGVITATLIERPWAKVTALVFGIPARISAYWLAGLYAATQFYHLRSPDSGVAWWCHIGGMVAGVLLFPLLRRKKEQPCGA